MNRERLWLPRSEIYLTGGLRVRVVEGRKSPEDLRLDIRTDGWAPVGMDLPALLCDFFAENEDALLPYRPHWRKSGQGYFMNEMYRAVGHGWQAVADDIERHRRNRQ